MNPLIIIAPAALIALLVVYGVLRAVGRVWLEHRTRLALLERLQQKPELLDSFQEIQGLLSGASIPLRGRHQDYGLTGFLLTLIGVGCAFLGRELRMGRLAVGVYVGGLLCVAFGVVLILAGLFLRWLSRSLTLPLPPKE